MSHKIRALVVEDSAYNRRTIVSMLESSGKIEVIGIAADGEEGVKQALMLKPDVITLDLEMPKMDGFTFLRILFSRRPTPVVVISSNAHKQNVFKALELGALDFISKPARHIAPELTTIRDELVQKVLVVRQLKRTVFEDGVRTAGAAVGTATGRRRRRISQVLGPRDQWRLAVIGASTGGPSALARVLSGLVGEPPLCILVAVHMPPKFTRAFAERLNRNSQYKVQEASDLDEVVPGVAYVAPGGKHMLVEKRGRGSVVRVVEEHEGAKYRPSVDLLFKSSAEVFGSRALGVVLTGMGDDGREGIKAIKEKGGQAIAESQETAVVYGMPKEAKSTGALDRQLPLGQVAAAIESFAAKPEK